MQKQFYCSVSGCRIPPFKDMSCLVRINPELAFSISKLTIFNIQVQTHNANAICTVYIAGNSTYCSYKVRVCVVMQL